MKKKIKILITGSCGFIGSNLLEYLNNKNFNVFGIDVKDKKEKKYFNIDLTNANQTKKIIDKIKPDVIIHTVGLSSLKACDENPALAQKINVVTTKNIADTLKNKSCKLIFISSDYVFAGTKGNYKENDLKKPQTVYGKNKLEAENYIQKNLTDYTICRTANVYGNGGGNFFNFILENLEKKQKLFIYQDTFFTPTHINDLLKSFEIIIHNDLKGIYHLIGSSKESRYTFSQKIAKYFNQDKKLIIPINKPKDDPASLDCSLNNKFAAKILKYRFLSTDTALKKTKIFFRKNKPYFLKKDLRGLIYGITNNKTWKEINYLESMGNMVRGGHYHKKTHEGFYIISGKIKVTIKNLKTKNQEEFVVQKGDIFIINPYELHTFKMLKKSSWINMLTVPINPQKPDIHQR